MVCAKKDELEFDHIDPTSKLYTVTAILKGDKRKLVDELAKCQLLCSNHHKEKTRRESAQRITHGKSYAARTLACSCDRCAQWRESDNADRRELRTGNREKPVKSCGTYAMYKAGCRCLSCKEANTSYMRKYREDKLGHLVKIESHDREAVESGMRAPQCPP